MTELFATHLDEISWRKEVDLLQVDAEGFDDEVIYNSDIDVTKPHLINFEAASLSADRHERLSKFLSERGYHLTPHGTDTLAIRTSLRQQVS
jgi:hypothetical protein